MNITITKDQTECQLVMLATELAGKVEPIPPNKSCCGVAHIGQDLHMVIENDNGRFTLHLLEDSTDAEAFAYFDKLNEGRKSRNPRLVYPHQTACSAANN